MSLRNAFGSLATEAGQMSEKELLEGVLYCMSAMLEKMPRLDGADRLVIANETTQTVALTTLATLSNQTNIGGRDASHVAYAMANIGSAHIYNQIQVS